MDSLMICTSGSDFKYDCSNIVERLMQGHSRPTTCCIYSSLVAEAPINCLYAQNRHFTQDSDFSQVLKDCIGTFVYMKPLSTVSNVPIFTAGIPLRKKIAAHMWPFLYPSKYPLGHSRSLEKLQAGSSGAVCHPTSVSIL